MKLSDLASALKYIPIKLDIGDSALDIQIRLPLKAEIEAIRSAYSTPDELKIEDEYQRLSSPVLTVLAELESKAEDGLAESIGVIKEENDTRVRGSDGQFVSLRTVAKYNVSNQIKTQLLFALIKREEGEEEPTYESIVEQLPESVVRAIVEGIEEAIHPSYEVARKK